MQSPEGQLSDEGDAVMERAAARLREEEKEGGVAERGKEFE